MTVWSAVAFFYLGLLVGAGVVLLSDAMVKRIPCPYCSRMTPKERVDEVVRLKSVAGPLASGDERMTPDGIVDPPQPPPTPQQLKVWTSTRGEQTIWFTHWRSGNGFIVFFMYDVVTFMTTERQLVTAQPVSPSNPPQVGNIWSGYQGVDWVFTSDGWVRAVPPDMTPAHAATEVLDRVVIS